MKVRKSLKETQIQVGLTEGTNESKTDGIIKADGEGRESKTEKSDNLMMEDLDESEKEPERDTNSSRTNRRNK